MSGSISVEPYGLLPDGTAVEAITLWHHGGLMARILTYGATLTALAVPDAQGALRNVVLGLPSLEAYCRSRAHLGGIVGRYANRIAGGRFTLDGVTYALPLNAPPNTLHGGTPGFDQAVWRIVALEGGACPAIALAHVSPDGEQGFPGRLEVRVRYALEADALRLDFTATTDHATVVNLANHSYFNLGDAGDVLGHELQIAADFFTPVDAAMIPTGELRAVADTPFDFRQPVPIGARIDEPDMQLVLGRGYDHNFVLRGGDAGVPAFAARVREPGTGLEMEVWTTEPGLQFYSGNHLDGSDIDAHGRPLQRRHGFCLETQHFPDSPNQPAFPSTVLRPGNTFRSTTLFRFPRS